MSARSRQSTDDHHTTEEVETQSEREPNGALDPQRAARIRANRLALWAVAANERATRRKTPGGPEEGVADETISGQVPK
jgi:hypothetical protein